MANETDNKTKQSLFVYRLTLGDCIMTNSTQTGKLTIEQEIRKPCNDGAYIMTLHGVNVKRKIYQPSEITAELDLVKVQKEAEGGEKTLAPSFKEAEDLLLKRLVKLELVVANRMQDVDGTDDHSTVYTIAENYYVHVIYPQLKRVASGITVMSVKLNIYSMDMLMTLNKYSKAYVARKLGSGILKPESLCFGEKDKEPLIRTNIKGMRFLKYEENVKFTDSHGKTSSASIPSEFIQPYLVQYNESFYDFLVRTANRCGEFLYFEDGELTLGLPDSGDPVMIDDFETVTLQSVTPPPLAIPLFARDSAKEGNGPAKHYNYSAIEKDGSFPKEIFPANTSYNSELATDEYIYPLYKDKATDLQREMMYDGTLNASIFKTMKIIKQAAASTKDKAKVIIDAAVIKSGVVEAVLTGLTAIEESAVNRKLKKNFFDPMKGNREQCNGDKLVQFGTLSDKGWITLNYYSDVRQHEEKQMQEMICINMNTNFYPLKLGQKIAIPGTDRTYVVTEIETGQNGEQRSMKVIAIPSYEDEGKHECFIPPVQPVPVTRKSGPQTAFIVASNDPKFQGRVRITYPWQSLGGQIQERLAEATVALQEAEQSWTDMTNRKQRLQTEYTRLTTEQTELADWNTKTAAQREARRKEIEDDISNRKENIRSYEDAIDKAIKAVSDKEAEIDSLPEDTDNREARLRELEEDRQVLIIKKNETINEQRPKIAEEEEAIARQKAHLEELAEMEDQAKRDTVLREKQAALDKAAELVKAAEDQEEAAKKKKDEKEQAKKKAEAEKDEKLLSIATPWIRVATPVATEGGGFYYEPSEGDEVLVNFDNDNVERPYVVGQLYSKENLDPRERMNRKQSLRKMGSMAIVSRNGHHISFNDPTDGAGAVGAVFPLAGVVSKVTKWGAKIPIVSDAMMKGIAPKQLKDLAGGIHIGDRYGLYEISMSSNGRKISINSPLGQVSLNAFTGISIKAVNGDIDIEGKNVSIKAGNKLTIESGTNIGLGPSMGKIDYAWSKNWKAPFHYFGHSVLVPGSQEIAKEVFKQFPITDLSLLRNMTQVFLRPVNGTMLIKSHKYMLLEAGRGEAKVKGDRFKKVVTDDYYMVYRTLIFCIDEIQNQFQSFCERYITLYAAAFNQHQAYLKSRKRILNKEPNIIKLANEINFNRDFDEQKTKIMDEYEKNDVFKSYAIKNRKRQVIENALLDAKAIYELKRHVYSLKGLFDYIRKMKDARGVAIPANPKDTSLNYSTWVLKAFINLYDDTDSHGSYISLLTEWVDTYTLGITPNEAFLKTKDATDRLATEPTEIMRELAAKFIFKVSQCTENKVYKYIYIGYDEKDIFRYGSEKLKEKFYWTRFIKNMDRYIQNSVAWREFLMSWANSFWNNQRNPEKWGKGKDIWDSDKHGQILMSDDAEYTLNLVKDGVQSEDADNLYNLDKLKRKLYVLQFNK